jgi:hypothetical protein
LNNSALYMNNLLILYLNNSLIVARSAEEGLATLTGKGPEVEACRGFVTHPALLVLQGVDRAQLKRKVRVSRKK